jgi:hypothetical protein
MSNQRQPGFWYSLKAVLWSFIGLRRKKDFDGDDARLNPVHIVIAALLAVAVFIGILVTVVRLVVAKS